MVTPASEGGSSQSAAQRKAAIAKQDAELRAEQEELTRRYNELVDYLHVLDCLRQRLRDAQNVPAPLFCPGSTAGNIGVGTQLNTPMSLSMGASPGAQRSATQYASHALQTQRSEGAPTGGPEPVTAPQSYGTQLPIGFQQSLSHQQALDPRLLSPQQHTSTSTQLNLSPGTAPMDFDQALQAQQPMGPPAIVPQGIAPQAMGPHSMPLYPVDSQLVGPQPVGSQIVSSQRVNPRLFGPQPVSSQLVGSQPVNPQPVNPQPVNPQPVNPPLFGPQLGSSQHPTGPFQPNSHVFQSNQLHRADQVQGQHQHINGPHVLQNHQQPGVIVANGQQGPRRHRAFFHPAVQRLFTITPGTSKEVKAEIARNAARVLHARHPNRCRAAGCSARA